MSDIEEVARAVQQVAQAGEKSLEVSEKIGAFFAKVFCEPATEIAAMITDRLRFVRWKRLLKTAEDVNRILKERGIRETRAVTPKLALPIFEESSLEDDESLHSLWNNLLANAMDPNFKGEIRSAYTEIIKNLDPADARLLFAMYSTLKQLGKLEFAEARKVGMKKDAICKNLTMTERDYLVSANNLMRLRCIAPFILHIGAGNGLSMPGNEKFTIDKGTDVVAMTPLGITFVEACSEQQ